MTNTAILQWIKKNLSQQIKQAVSGTIYTEDWLAAMAYREVGFLIARYVSQGYKVEQISLLMRGDYGQRKGDPEKIYHGYSYWQIDINSYPDFIKSGYWKDPLKSCTMAVKVLEEKRIYLKQYNMDTEDAITAAYNTGQGNVRKNFPNVDATTFNKDYAKQVREFRSIYLSLP